jgi:hypothetical protein
MAAIPKPPRRGPKPRKPIKRTTPLKRSTKPIARRTRVRPISAKQRAKIKLRTEVTRPQMLTEDSHQCRACKKNDGWWGGLWWWLELNEHPPRSRGGDMNNPAHCITLCACIDGISGCHQKYTAGKLKIETIDKERGCRAPVEFTDGSRTWQG